MQMFSNCSGTCETCQTHFTGGCLAGHGDDDYIEVTKEWAEKALQNGWIRDSDDQKELRKLLRKL